MLPEHLAAIVQNLKTLALRLVWPPPVASRVFKLIVVAIKAIIQKPLPSKTDAPVSRSRGHK